MRSVIVYESMFGNTHAIADSIAEGLRDKGEVVVLTVEQATVPGVLDAVDLLVVGGPTHAHGMSSQQSRGGAPQYVEKSDGDLHLEPDYAGPGLRDWFHDMAHVSGPKAAAFDTRVDMAVMLTGHASKGIASRLKKSGYPLVAEPESFLVDKANHLLPGEAERAVAWGATLAEHWAHTG